jgi:hypothetical protein
MTSIGSDLLRWTVARRFPLTWAHIFAAATFAAAMGFAIPTGVAEGVNPFAKFLGSWRGSGQVLFTNGDVERINCRANYLSLQAANELSLDLVCATESYRIEIRSQLVAVGREVQGTWTETSRQVTGNLVGRLSGGSFEGNIEGPGFTAEMSLHSTGRKQSVSIRPQSTEMQVSNVDIDLSRETDR